MGPLPAETSRPLMNLASLRLEDPSCGSMMQNTGGETKQSWTWNQPRFTTTTTTKVTDSMCMADRNLGPPTSVASIGSRATGPPPPEKLKG